MTRHGKNATNGAVYSYHERRKDAKASGFGSEKTRFSKDSIKGNIFFSLFHDIFDNLTFILKIFFCLCHIS